MYSLSLETIVIFILVAFIIGMVVGVSMSRPRFTH